MRSHCEVPARRRQMNVDVDVVDGGGGGWPLGRRHGGQEEQRVRISSGAAEEEIEGLVEQFAFLKPCRQLEKQYASRRNAHKQCHAGNSSFRHGGEAMAQGRDGRDQRLDARAKPRRQLKENSQCRLLESDSKPTTIRELLTTDAERGRVRNHDATRAASSSDKCAAEEDERAHSISVAAQRALARKLSRDGIELNSFVADASSASPRRSVSERFATRGHDFHHDVWRISSTRCSIHEKEAHIDLVAPAAAKFLVETATPRARQYYYSASPPGVAVPFQWEDAPGRAKPARAARASPDALQLPPRLAVPSRAGQSFSSRELRVSTVVSHPLAGLFPCMTASSPSWSHHHRARETIKPSLHETPPIKARKLNKSFSQPLASTDASPIPKPRRLFSSELKPDSTSILHHSGRHSSSSRTYLSACDLDASTPRSKSSSSVSYESIGEDFVDSPRSDGVKGLRKLSCLRKSRSRAQRVCSPEVWSYLQHLDANNHEDVTLLPEGGAPTSSGYLNSRGEPVAISTERATRLPYKMPSVEEQERAARGAAVEVCSSSSSAPALEMTLSPAVSIIASRRQRGGPRQPPGWVGAPKPHRRVQFILSICKTLKRVLFRQQPRRSVIGTRLMYYDERAPTTFQFSKPN